MSRRWGVLLGIAIAIGCVDRGGSELEEPTPPPDDEAFEIVETFCENIGVPCNIEEPCGPDEGIPCYSLEDCQYYMLEIMKCKSDLTCREAEDDRTGRAHYCDDERWDLRNAGCGAF